MGTSLPPAPPVLLTPEDPPPGPGEPEPSPHLLYVVLIMTMNFGFMAFLVVWGFDPEAALLITGLTGVAGAETAARVIRTFTTSKGTDRGKTITNASAPDGPGQV